MQIQFTQEEYNMMLTALSTYSLQLEEDLVAKAGNNVDPIALNTVVQYKVLLEKLQHPSRT